MILFLIQRFVWIMCQMCWKLFFRLEVRGTENIEALSNGKVIFAANHLGMFDPFLLGSNIPKSYFRKTAGLKLLTYYKFIHHRWYGPLIRLVGAYPVWPNNGKDLSETLGSTIKYLNTNYSIVMFPQGQRHPVCEVNDSRPGVAYLAKNTGAVIVPVLIQGSYHITLIDLILHRRSVLLSFGQAVSYSEVEDKEGDLRRAAARIMSRVCALEEKLEAPAVQTPLRAKT